MRLFSRRLLIAFLLALSWMMKVQAQAPLIGAQPALPSLSSSQAGIAAGGANPATASGLASSASPVIVGQEAVKAGDAALPESDKRRVGEKREDKLKADEFGPIHFQRLPVEANRFQRFVLEATGQGLPVYGLDYFASAPAPRENIPVPADYPLGPGDEVVVRAWGAVEIDYRAVIDRHGQINLPRIGPIRLAGVRAGEVREVVRAAVSKTFRGFELDVTLGKLRGITVYVTGQARRPGAYHLSSLSTLVSALFESGGPNANGSLRRVRVLREGKTVAEVDLYAFLAKGDNSADVRLLDGDVIMIPPAAGFVALMGEVKTPAIYELRAAGDTIASLLELSGGISIAADPGRAILERIDPETKRPRSVEALALKESSLTKTLKDGDILMLLPVLPSFGNAITLNVGREGSLRLPFKQGMKVADVVPSREFLLTQTSVKGQYAPRAGASLAEAVGSWLQEFVWDYALIERLDPASLRVDLIPFDLGMAIDHPGSPENKTLAPGDIVNVFSVDDVRVPLAKRRVLVRLEGEVKRPGVYPVGPGESLVNLIMKAGGLTTDAYLFGAEFYRESVRKRQQENLDKLISRLEQTMLGQVSTLAGQFATDPAAAQQVQARLAVEKEQREKTLQRLRSLKSTGRVVLAVDPKAPSLAQLPDFRLEPGDRLVIPSRPDFVQVFGAVNTEAALIWQPGKTVGDVLAQAGVSPDADKSAIFVIRADGSVASNGDRWFSSVAGLEVLPGDIVVVPEKTDKETFWSALTRGIKDYSQIFMNFGLGAAAFKSLNN